MPVSLKHAKTSTKPDGTDTSAVRPSDWNAEHVLTMGTGKLLGRTMASTGAAEEISVGGGLSLTSGTLQLSPAVFSAYANGGQSVSSATWTKVACNTEEFDSTSAYDAATNYRFQPTVAGYYQLTGQVGYANANNAPYCASIYKNGTEFKRGTYINSGTIAACVQVSSLIYLNGSTDYVELWTWHQVGVSQPLAATAASNYFQGHLVATA